MLDRLKEHVAALNDRGLPARIAARIGRSIIQGELTPGAKLPRELDMLEKLQVSRTTLREALTILSSKGFIEAKQRVGTRVREPDHWNTLDPVVMSWQGDGEDSELIQELFDMRMAIEPQAARLAATRATVVDIEKINFALAQMGEDHRDPQGAIDADIQFHLGIIQAAHNRFLLPVSTVIRTALAISVPKTFNQFGGMKHSLPMHANIAGAIEHHDPAQAETAMKRLLQGTYERNFKFPV